MAMRLFGFHQPRNEPEQSAAFIPESKPAPPVQVVGSRLDGDPELSIAETDYDSGDPYNSTGRFLAEEIRNRRDD